MPLPLAPFAAGYNMNVMERRLESLGGEWEVVRIDKRSGQPAGNPFTGTVPGDLISDLVRNGMLDDPYLDVNSEKCLWINDYDWVYRKRFSGGCPALERKFLRFAGVDYEAWIRLNGHVLGAHEGMFGRIVFEITSHMEEENEVEVLLVGRANTWRERIKGLNPILRSGKARMKTLKAQYSFGWDFAPALKGAGIWDEVHIHSTGPVAIDDIWIRPDLTSGSVDTEIFLSSRASGDGELAWRVEPVGHEAPGCEGVKTISFAAGPQSVGLKFDVPDAQAWESWDLGDQNLYRLSVEVRYGSEPSDEASDTFGFRNIGFESNPRAPEGSAPWTLVINGRRLFLRGVNWIPMDSLLARLDEKRYRKLLTMARDMGANLIRVWGGGLREKKIFYDLCDELGLLVWQEFPFACAIIEHYPRSGHYLKLVARECADIIRQLRNHPSLFLWCGGNELHAKKNEALIDTVRHQVETHDTERRFHPVSPALGDSHNWVVWHGKGNPEDYLEDKAPMISEFGLQAVPVGETVEAMLSEKFRWPPDKKAWKHHNIDWGKMLKYVRNVPAPNSLEEFIEATQRMQAHILKTSIERWRRMKFTKGGFAIWQLNDPWPAVTWSLVDYFGRPKLSYHALKMSMAPLAVAIFYPLRRWRYGDKVPYDIAVINDYHRSFHGLTARVFLGDREVDSARFEIRPNSVAAAEDRRVELDCDPPRVLRITLSDAQGAELAKNEHDLEVFDPVRAPFLARWFSAAMWRWMTKGTAG